MTSSSPAASTKAPRSSRSACRSSIRPRRSGSSRRCRSSPSLRAQRSNPFAERGLLPLARNDGSTLNLESDMKRFNLSGWAVQPSAAGPVPDDRARRRRLLLLSAARPRRGSVLHGQGGQRLGDLAGRHRAGDAGPGRRPDREEAAGTAVFRQGADLYEAGLHGDAGHVQGLRRRRRTCRTCSTCCARSSPTCRASCPPACSARPSTTNSATSIPSST